MTVKTASFRGILGYNETRPQGAGHTSRPLTRTVRLDRTEGSVKPTQESKTCRFCGETFTRRTKVATAEFAKRRYCSNECRDRARPSIVEDYDISESGCWEWRGRMDANGYGKAYDAMRPPGHRVDWAHRVSWRRHRGEIPAGMELDHMCENTRCINPDHLQVLTKSEHVAVTLRRLGKDDIHAEAARLRIRGLTYEEIADALGYAGRTSAESAVKSAIAKGLVEAKQVPRARHLTEADRGDIRSLFSLGIPQREIAAWYEIDNGQISRICSGARSRRGEGSA